jgi:2-C-methyl-D-erythritol 4-phosphate cytidylyltransferase
MAREILANEIPNINIEITYGGKTRHGSEYQAMLHLKNEIQSGNIDVVLIHDGARPLATPELYKKIAEVAVDKGGAIPTTTINSAEIDLSHDTQIVRVQTPQGFRAKELLAAYEKAEVDGFVGTDTGACVEAYFPEIKAFAVEAEVSNLKITFAQDLELAAALLEL